MADRKSQASYVRIVLGGMTVDGKPCAPDLNYKRTEYDDGTVVETGRPDGVPPGASLCDVFAHHLKGLVPGPTRSASRQRKGPKR